MTKLEKLYELARNNNKEAIDELFKIMYPTTERKAHFIYQSIVNNIKEYYDIIPNSLIDYEDILQDISLKVYKYILDYFNNNHKEMLSTFVANRLKSYINTTINDKTQEIINKLNNSINQNINFQFRDIDEDHDTIFELIDLIGRNYKFNKHYNFILDIINGYSYNELAKKYNLNVHGLSVKIKYISKLYQDSLEPKNLLYDYIKNDFIAELKNGNLFELSYFKEIIINIVHDIYKYLKDNFYNNYKTVKDEYLNVLYNNIISSIDSIDEKSDVLEYIKNISKLSKEQYLEFKISELEYIKSCNYQKYFINNQEITSNEALKLILNGNIFKIYPYCNFIELIVEEIVIKTNQDRKIVKATLRNIIGTLIKCYKDCDISIEELNLFLKERLEKRVIKIYKPKNLIIK